jgi:hypothetical protein
MTAPDPTYTGQAHVAGWSMGGIIGVIVIAMVVIGTIITYTPYMDSTNTETGPSSTNSEANH